MKTGVLRKRAFKSTNLPGSFVAIRTLFYAMAAVIVFTDAASAQTTYSWLSGTSTGNWSTSANWSGSVVPPTNSADTVLSFSLNGASNYTITNDLGTVVLNRLFLGGSTAKGVSFPTGSVNFEISSASVLPTLVFQRTAGAGASSTTFSLPFTVTNALTITNNNAVSALTIKGSITDNAGITLTGSSGATLDTGVISGTGGITLNAATGWSLNGLSNTYTGTTAINNGTISIAKVAAGAAVQSLGEGTTVTLGVAGTSSGKLTYTGGTGTLSKNIYALGNGGDTINNTGGGVLTLSGTLTKANTVLTLTGGNFLVSGQITGGVLGSGTFNSDLVINGGTTTLTNANNNYVGPTYVYGGATLKNGVLNALPTSTVLTLGGTNNTAGTYDIGGFNQTLSGLTNTGSGSAVVTNSAAGTGTNTVTINNDTSTSNANYTFGGVIQNGATAVVALAKTGNQSFLLTGANTYTGATTVGAGTLEVDGSLSASSAVTVDVATLSGTGNVGGSVALTGASNISSSGTLTVGSIGVTGLGNTISPGTVNATAGTTVSGSSSLAVNGTLGGGTVAVTGSGAVLSGSGRITSVLTVSTGGRTYPGAGSGAAVLTITAGVTYNTSTTAEFGIFSGTTTHGGNAGAGTAFDQIKVTGGGSPQLQIGTGSSTTQIAAGSSGSALSGITLTLNMTGAVFTALQAGASSSYQALGSNSSLNNYFVFELGSNVSNGRFQTLDLDIDGTDYSATIQYGGTGFGRFGSTPGVTDTVGDVIVNGQEFALSYTGDYLTNSTTGGNDIVLTAIPEPGTWGMILGGFGMLVSFQKLRKRRMGS